MQIDPQIQKRYNGILLLIQKFSYFVFLIKNVFNTNKEITDTIIQNAE